MKKERKSQQQWRGLANKCLATTNQQRTPIMLKGVGKAFLTRARSAAGLNTRWLVRWVWTRQPSHEKDASIEFLAMLLESSPKRKMASSMTFFTESLANFFRPRVEANRRSLPMKIPAGFAGKKKVESRPPPKLIASSKESLISWTNCSEQTGNSS